LARLPNDHHHGDRALSALRLDSSRHPGRRRPGRRQTHPHDRTPHRHHRNTGTKDNTMNEITIHDELRDGLALIRACLDNDVAAAEVISNNCDLVRVLSIVTGIAVQALIDSKGEDGTRAWLDRWQHELTSEA
jgi:hypothetical protein